LRVSYNWIKEYVEFDWSPEELAERLTMAGLEVEEIEKIIPESKKIVVGKVLEIKEHPDSSRLHICNTDVGSRKVSIVCAAPNVKEGEYFVTALPGAFLPSGKYVEETKIRGIVSEGMLCSEKELGISDDHSGILVLDKKFQPGEMFQFGPENRDAVLDIVITPNRADCMSIIGIAREIAALSGNRIKMPKFSLEEGEDRIEDDVVIEIQDRVNCPRYTARVIKDVKIAPSPFWLVKKLESVGLRTINSIVDITNYVLMELGQPLHAFDLSLIYDHKIIVRLAKNGEGFATLDGVERVLDSGSLLICDGKRPVALAGIMGGINSEVSEDTKDVLLESANFNPINIRKTSQKLGLSTDASIRFERGVDPQIVDFASDRAIGLMKRIAGGRIVKGCLDVNYLKKEEKFITLHPDRVNKILGKKIQRRNIVSILEGLEFLVKKNKNLVVSVPSFRKDVTREIDLVEEIARIYGYDNIEEVNFSTINIQTKIEDNVEKYIGEFRNIFVGMGFYEIITNSIVGDRQKDWIENEAGLIKLKNPISEGMNWMRKTLVENVLKIIEYNKNREQKNVRIFEIGKVFSAKSGVDSAEFESLNIAGAIEGTIEFPNWKIGKTIVDFYCVKGIIETFFNKIFLNNYEFFYYDKNRLSECCGIKIDNVYSGFFGRVEDNYIDIPGKNNVYIFEIFLDNIIKKISQRKLKFIPIPQFPSIERDLVFLLSKDVSAKELINYIKINGGEYLKKVDVFDLYEGEQIPKDKKSIGFSLQFYSLEKTLKESEIDEVIERIINELRILAGAELRKK